MSKIKCSLEDLMILYDSNLDATISDLERVSGLPRRDIVRFLNSNPQGFIQAKRKLNRNEVVKIK